ncbi:hypothetical protein PUN28_003744 [Cardiocondyla obscurior]|uniref:Uncharacterized protein n=1 Tax=Cardiocondyla obscurior TaxID=286306 RepID=A0AAW2GK36_9HYME
MVMSAQRNEGLPSQGDRISRDRRESGIVSATLPSLSNDGLPVTCTAGVSGDYTPAKYNVGKRVERQLSRVISDKVVTSDLYRLGPKCIKNKESRFTGIKSHAGLPSPTVCESTTNEEDYTDGSSRPSTPGNMFSISRRDTPIILNDKNFTNVLSADSYTSIRTTASGTTKRSKTSHKREHKLRRMQPTDVDSSSKIDMQNLPKKKRGRPKKRKSRLIITSKRVNIHAIKTAKNELERLREDIKTAREIARSNYDLLEFESKKGFVMAKKLEEKMANLPSRDIVAEVLLTAQKVDHVAQKVSNLKGGFVRILRKAALKIRIRNGCTNVQNGLTEA